MKLLLFCFCLVSIFKLSTQAEVPKHKQSFNTLVYQKIRKLTQDNFLVSPNSLRTILDLILRGSNGDTAAEIQRCLNKSHQNLVSGGDKDSFKVANKIYVDNTFSLKDSFRKTAENFHVNYENVDFRQKTVVQDINGWVSDQTNHKIQNLIEPSTINPRTRLLLLNALYFQANWAKPFLIAYTRKFDFYLSSFEVVKVDTMLLYEKYFNYYEDKKLGASFLELPFEGDETSMVIVLPDKNNTLCSVENQMERVLEPRKFTRQFVNVALPKFRIETKIDFKKILKKMGVRKMFIKKYADLSGISGKKGDLVVNDVGQKTFIDVSERGVEAAAATYFLELIPMSAPFEKPKQFRVNRPFIFYINVKGAVIFVGRVQNPTT